MPRTPFHLRALAAAWVTLVVAIVGACSSSKDGDSGTTCTIEIGQACRLDEQCCSGNCMWQGTGAFCQSDKAPPAACSPSLEGCTQNRHCCSGHCNGRNCSESADDYSEGGVPVQDCKAVGDTCSSIFECCSANCTSEGTCGEAVSGGTGGGGGSSCRLRGQACFQNGQCCEGRCQGKKCI